MSSFKQITGSIMRVVRVRFAAMIGIAFMLVLSLHMLLSAWSRSPTIEEIQKSDEGTEQACRHPDLELINPLILKHVVNLGELDCKRGINWVEIHNQSIVINKDAVRQHGFIHCKVTYFHRRDEFAVETGQTVLLASDEGQIPLKGDFFHVNCEAKNKKKWKNLMCGVVRNQTAVARAKSLKPLDGAMKLNVLMFGLDSMSRLHWMRKLPKTTKYLVENLKASVLKGYNIVGDGTPQALIPILTGYTEQELPETRKRMNNAQFVNVYPFAWKNFSASGYVSAYGEDSPYTGTFTYRLKGFDEIPTDHYMRSFYLELEKEFKNHPKYCLANTPRHVVMMNWVRYFYDSYPDVLKFGFVFHSELSHDDYNLVGYEDTDIEKFLKNLYTSGILNNTLLIVMSDHGHRFANIRESQQGKQEERLPFFSIALPPWFEEKYPVHARNLRTNENRLVTPFDIHATFMTLLYPDVPVKGEMGSRSISLFSEIPQERTCSMASIEPHWCACLSWAKVSPEDPIAKDVAKAVIDFINGLTEFQRKNCAPLEIKELSRIEKLQPNKALLKFRKNADKDGFVGEFSDNTQLSEIIYQIQIRTSPNNGVYEASLKYDVTKKEFSVKEHEISRVNMYGNQEHCIHDTYPNLRKYCYCREQL
ncbi:uncharacterized protein LOC129235195 isoform X2 [Uloborus diversus]|uniref:uncharacterized protein LOC129235195 isoform X2 n=1 Tax=Uloborus diversus TaxID=327109 RepID=UPI002409207E|nr:uncharacterized protein LOC129235195 isoform X2 [Uloborus diversus]